MVKQFSTPIYQPMNQTKTVMKQYNDYLKQIDKKYGTQFTVRDWKKAGN